MQKTHFTQHRVNEHTPGDGGRMKILATVQSGKVEVSDKLLFAEQLSKHEGKQIYVTIEPADKKRTVTQNNALHLYFKLLADSLTAGGFDAKATFAESANVPVTPEMIKDGLWKPVMKQITTKTSTAKLTTAEVGNIYEILNRHISETFGLHIPFPDVTNMGF